MVLPVASDKGVVGVSFLFDGVGNCEKEDNQRFIGYDGALGTV
jgi:hypothetical protein